MGRRGRARSVGTFCDRTVYADLRVTGLVAENDRRQGPRTDLRTPLLVQIARDVSRREDQSLRPGREGDEMVAELPRPPRRGRSVGCNADRRDFRDMRVDALQYECRTRGLSSVGRREDMLRRVLSDVELREHLAAGHA